MRVFLSIEQIQKSEWLYQTKSLIHIVQKKLKKLLRKTSRVQGCCWNSYYNIFTLSLDDAEAQILMDGMILKNKCVDYISRHHVSEYISINDLREMTSSDHRNGKRL